MDVSVMFFSSLSDEEAEQSYRHVLSIARQADAAGMSAIWLPERHFHRFGGLFPNPAVLAAAIAVVTSRVEVRAGSVVAALHDPIRIAEEWSMVTALAGGRAGVSFATGWNPMDFVLAPQRFSGRREAMWSSIDTVRRLWRGESVTRPSGDGSDVDVQLHPRPGGGLSVWGTSSGSASSVTRIAHEGMRLLTHLVDQDVNQLANAVQTYRSEYRGGSEPHVTVMLHTYLDASADEARDVAFGPLCQYLRDAVELEQLAAGVAPGDVVIDEELIELTAERYLERSSLIGDLATCADIVERLRAIGVDEIACLVDFGLPWEAVSASMDLIAKLVPAVVRS